MRFLTILLRRVDLAILFVLASWQLAAAVQSPPGPSNDVQRKVESTTKFIFERSGFEINRELKRRLLALEQRSLNVPSARVNTGELVEILTDIALERLSRLSDQEIKLTLNTYRHDPNPKHDYVEITDDGRYTTTAREFVRTLKSYREMSRQQDPVLRNTLRQFIRGKGLGEGVNGRVELYTKGLTEFAGAEDGLTASQSLLVVYSLVSDDILSVPIDRLRIHMEHVHETIGGDQYPSPKDRFPFGARGYLFPTPIDIILNEKTLWDLLDRLEQKMNER